jgi:hypothetical protein
MLTGTDLGLDKGFNDVDLVRFTTKQGNEVLVETLESEPGFRNAGVSDRIADAQKTFESALADVADAAETALSVLRSHALRPDGIEIEFGVRFSAETGAVIAKAALEGNLKVKITWAGNDAADNAS